LTILLIHASFYLRHANAIVCRLSVRVFIRLCVWCDVDVALHVHQSSATGTLSNLG